MSTEPKRVGTVEGFSRSLAELTINSKPHINFLTIIAQENSHQPEAIVEAVHQHLKKTSRIMKLPTLYLIDSIMKNVGNEYINLFSSVLVNEFANIYAEVDKNTRQLMGVLRQSWSGVILPTDLSKLDVQVHTLDQQWQLSSDTLKNTTIKILLNPNFLPQKVPEKDSSPVEPQELNDDVDEAEVLREQLLQELRKKKKQSEKNNESQMREEVTEKNCISEAPIVIDLEARESQVDSTTIDKSPDSPSLEICPEMPSSESAPVDPVVPTDKPLSSGLLVLLSDLIAKQNVKSHTNEKHQVEKLKEKEFPTSRRHSGRSERRSYKKNWRDDRSKYRFRKEVNDCKTVPKDHQFDQTLSKKEGDSSQIKRQQSKVSSSSKNWSDSPVSATNHSSIPHLSQEKSSTPERGRSFNHTAREYKRPLLPTPTTSALILESTEHICSSQTRGIFSVQKIQNETISFGFSHNSKEFSSTSSRKKDVLEIKLQKEIDYNHGLGSPGNQLVSKIPTINHHSSNELPLLHSPMWSPSSPVNVEFQQRQSLVNTCFEGPLYSLPPANSYVLGKIAQDTVKTIQLDSETKEIQFYGETAVINAGGNEPKEISFKPGEASISVNNAVVHTAFNQPENIIFIDGKIFRVHFGAPTRELYVNDEAFQCQFNFPPEQIQLSSGEVLTVQLHSKATPLVDLGAIRRDLVAGHVILTIDGTQMLRILLHAKPQRFDIDGVPHILKFADALQSIFINDYPVNIRFGGPPICINVNGVKHQLRLSNLPFNVIPGEVTITSMAVTGSRPCTPTNDVYHQPALPSITSSKVVSTKFSSNDKEKRKQKSRNSDWPKRRKTGSKQSNKVPCMSGEIKNTDVPAQDNSAGRIPPLSFYPNTNIHTLFQSLCEVGLLIPNSPSTCLQRDPISDVEVHPVNFEDLSSLKRKQPGMVELLYSGVQCNSCGARFPPELTDVYRQHLDWHFHHNHRTRFSSKCQSRSWYNERDVWIKSEAEGCRDTMDVEDELSSKAECEKIPRKKCSVPSHGHPQGTVCEMCGDIFDEFFNEDQDEWHLENCVLFEDKLYHPACYDDRQASKTIDSMVNTQILSNDDKATQDQNEICTENTICHTDSAVPLASEGIDATELGNASDDSEISVVILKEASPRSREKECTDAKEVVSPVFGGEEEPAPGESRVDLPSLIKQSVDRTNVTEINSIKTNDVECSSSVVCDNCTEVLEASIPNDNETKLLLPLESGSEDVRTVCLKSKLVGRKLSQLPPVIKGSETSNMCILS